MLGHSKFKLTDLEKDKTLVLMQGRWLFQIGKEVKNMKLDSKLTSNSGVTPSGCTCQGGCFATCWGCTGCEGGCGLGCQGGCWSGNKTVF